MPSCETPFVPVLPLSWQKLSSSRSGKKEQAVITGCKHKYSFPHPAKYQAAANQLFIFQYFAVSSESFHDILQIVTTVGERLMQSKSEKPKCTDTSVTNAHGLAVEREFKGAGGRTSEQVHRCQQLPMKSIRAHRAPPGNATA